jgi:hypothetical protein
MPAMQAPLSQSVPTLQNWPGAQAGQLPPQSISVSVPSATPSVQLGPLTAASASVTSGRGVAAAVSIWPLAVPIATVLPARLAAAPSMMVPLPATVRGIATPRGGATAPVGDFQV